jgi:hypothetical protein
VTFRIIPRLRDRDCEIRVLRSVEASDLFFSKASKSTLNPPILQVERYNRPFLQGYNMRLVHLQTTSCTGINKATGQYASWRSAYLKTRICASLPSSWGEATVLISANSSACFVSINLPKQKIIYFAEKSKPSLVSISWGFYLAIIIWIRIFLRVIIIS